MEVSQIWFRLVRKYVKLGLVFYTKKIKVVGLKNVPKKGAVLFAINHPNGLIDPLIVTTNNPRASYFLVKAAAFKNPIIEKILNSLNLIAIYRMRDGIDQLAKNEEVFNKCYDIFNRGKSLMIFPEGSDCRDRTVRPLSKGFTRIVYGAIEKYPDLQIQVVPVGLTYQNASQFPSKVALHYGTPIDASEIYANNIPSKSINILKNEVVKQLKELSVYIEKDENYNITLTKLNEAQVDFTEVKKVQEMIKTNTFPPKKEGTTNYLKPLYYLIILNSMIHYFIYKKQAKKNPDIDFVDTFRYTYNLFVLPLFYALQAFIVWYLFGSQIALFYFTFSCFIIFIYSKFSPTNTEA
ncbi:1-acyl-sn-glycerol-3-phosphate acyltransferase [Polaribacter sp. Z014]|uniref:1-acyl-sn-glycerol-3-phosphate acyltransferase n=1 Tax=unclassified Polaribacter TaxID=196858 RepID=UPI00193BDEED|nr:MULTISPECIES: 1-acyl-sn-glycerol-3-phosphate acyltransferase [unclassified Polaribacter]MCL7763225.1 1-acyl-sn-glycerol-3-phosphate acyltransferase [Polaribacter sp. Z014]QVY67164.1 1-acyl-sn-glycerol-3-phosphate acyltransferase [Polaribacter sp. Q13]